MSKKIVLRSYRHSKTNELAMQGRQFDKTNASLASQSIPQWRQLVFDWLANINSLNTRRAYLQAWNDFSLFRNELDPTTVRPTDVITYKNYLIEQDINKATINLRLAALSSFYVYAIERNLLEDNPIEGVKRHAVNPYGKASVLAEGQDMALLNQPDTDTVKGKRDLAILLILLTTGVRVAAVSKARLANLQHDHKGRKLIYQNKGGEEDYALILPFVWEAMAAYLKTRPEETLNGTDSVFMTIRTNSTSNKLRPLSSQAISSMISQYAKQAGLHHITAHSLRHTFATQAIQHGTVAEVSKALRHRSTRVTHVYLDHVDTGATDDLVKQIGERYLKA